MNVAVEGFTNRWVCTQCGICSVVCPTRAITMVEGPSGCTYPMVETEDCVACGLCTAVCPGATTSGPSMPSRPTETDELYGPFVGATLAHSADEGIRHAAASGGVATALMCSLLEQGQIIGSVVAAPGDEPGTAAFTLATTRHEVRAALGSRYTPTCLAPALKRSAARQGPIAVVGLPCQISGLRRAAHHVPWIKKAVVLMVSLFCAGTKDLRYRDLLLRRMGIPAEEVVDFSYRSPGWPGTPCALGADGSLTTMKPEAMPTEVWSRAAFTPPRCLVCDDPLGSAGDIVLGDPWRLGCEEDAGVTLTVARTAAGHEALRAAVARGDLVINAEVSAEQVVRSAQGTLWRRYHAAARRRVAALWAPGWRLCVHGQSSVRLADTMRALASLGRSALTSIALNRK